MDIKTKTLNTLEFLKILKNISSFAKTEQSCQLCLNAKIYNDIENISTQLKYTNEAKKILDMALDIPIDTISVAKNITGIKYLSESELIDIAKTLRCSRLVKNFLNSNAEELLLKLSDSLFTDKQSEEKIFSTFDENLKIKQNASNNLKNLYSSLKETEKNLKLKVNELLTSSNFTKFLQKNIYTTRDDRIVFQVIASAKNKVDGIVHDVSATNKTFYIEPAQIVPINNKIRELNSQIYSEEIKILTELTSLVKTYSNELINTENILAEIDFHFSKARYAVKLHAVLPEISKEKVIRLENMYHPLLADTTKKIVTNNFSIGKGYNSIIITGSNTGGKTVTLKTIGLFILMMKTGLFLPCTFAKIYPFENIFADIGDLQSIEQSLSTFSSHISNIVDIVDNSDSETLVLIDEICAGTDPTEGSVLATVILEYLARQNVFSVVTTHYGELKTLEYTNPYFKNASVEFDTETLKPTYKLQIGIPGLSNAIAISANLGLKKGLIDMAKHILITQKYESFSVVEKLQETQQMLSKNLAQANEYKETYINIKNEYETKLSELKANKKKAIKIINDKFDRELSDVKAEIKNILTELHQEKSEKIARRSYARLAKLENSFRDKIVANKDKVEYTEIDWNKVQINDNVMLRDLHQFATVLSLPDKKGKVLIQLGNLKTKIDITKLAVPDTSYKKTIKTYIPKTSEKFELRKINISSTLDLRGYRVEDALDSLEYYLDKASLAGLNTVLIIHGHGTGVLKNSVRDFLSISPYVGKYRIGEDAEGGDGVCVVDLK